MTDTQHQTRQDLLLTDRSHSASSHPTGLKMVGLDALASEQGRQARALYLDPETLDRDPREVLAHLRTHRELGLYLKPVVALTSAHQPPEWARMADLRWNTEQHPEGLSDPQQQQIAQIQRQIQRLEEIAADQTGSNLTLRVLRFIHTRQDTFRPERSAHHTAGFIYPRLSPLVEGDHFALLDILGQLQQERMLEGEFVSHLYQCSQCECAFLNFLETCMDCGAARLDVDDLTHHFQCAYTAPHEDFQQGGRLICPKCEDELRQLGVDYEKPSLVYTCRECHNVFQEPGVQTVCFQCGHQAGPEEQLEREICAFRVTAQGTNAARHGLEPAFLSRLRRETRVLSWDTFQIILEGEWSRIHRYENTQSSLLLMKLEGIEQLQSQLGPQAERVLQDLVEAFEQAVRDSDYLSVCQETIFAFLLTETDREGGQLAGQRLADNIKTVLEENLTTPPQPQFRVADLRREVDLEEEIEALLEA